MVVLTVDLLICVVECSQLDIIAILNFVIPKYATFQTRPLLAAFHTLFEELYSLNRDTFLSNTTRLLGTAVNGVVIKTNAVNNYFTLLDWVNYVFIQASRQENDFTKQFSHLVTWQAILLHHCLADAKKKGLKVSAVRTTRATLRIIFQRNENGSAV